MTTENTNEVQTEETPVQTFGDANVTTTEEVANETETETKPKSTKKGGYTKKTNATTGETEGVGIVLGDVTSTVSTVTGQVTPKLGIFKLNEHTTIPAYGTQDSACFDIRVNLQGELDSGKKTITTYTKHNQPIERRIDVDTDGRPYVEIRPYERLIAPTGAIFDIPEGYSLKVHPRSGTSLKQGINLINQEAVIDADYVDELKLLLVNSSEAYARIYHNERYAQGELQVVIQNEFVVLDEAPAQKTDRAGGLGHTGKH